MSLTLLWTNIWSHKNWIFFTQLGFENKRIYYISDFAKESSCFSLCYSFSRIVPVLRSITCLSWVFVWPSLFSTKSQPNQFQAPQICFFSIRLLFFNNTISSKITLTPIGKMFHCSSSPHPASLVRWFWARKRCRKLLKGLKFQYAFTKKGNILFKHWISRKTITSMI